MTTHVYLWLAHMASSEADSLVYAYPRPDGWEAEHDEWRDVSDRCFERGTRGLDEDQQRAAWRDAMQAWRA